MRELVPRGDRAGAAGEGLRPELHGRRRGSRPAGALARRDRGGRSPIPSLHGWDGLRARGPGLQKRAGAVIDWVAELARALDRRMTVRLVKGAYWDTEVKRAQERGLDDYPVFTRKSMTDLNYVACAEKLLGPSPAPVPAIRHPQRAHRRHHPGGGGRARRLRVPAPARHGRGAVRAAAGDRARRDLPRLRAGRRPPRPPRLPRPPAPGERRQLLLRLGRLRSGRAGREPARAPGRDRRLAREAARHPRLPLPRDLYGPDRANSRGVEFGDRAALEALLAEVAPAPRARVSRRRR